MGKSKQEQISCVAELFDIASSVNPKICEPHSLRFCVPFAKVLHDVACAVFDKLVAQALTSVINSSSSGEFCSYPFSSSLSAFDFPHEIGKPMSCLGLSFDQHHTQFSH